MNVDIKSNHSPITHFQVFFSFHRIQMDPCPRLLWCRALWLKKGESRSRRLVRLRWTRSPWDWTNTGSTRCQMVRNPFDERLKILFQSLYEQMKHSPTWFNSNTSVKTRGHFLQDWLNQRCLSVFLMSLTHQMEWVCFVLVGPCAHLALGCLHSGVLPHPCIFNSVFHHSSSLLSSILIPFTADGRQIAANMRGIGMMPNDIPEWKKHAFGGNKASYGKKTQLSILEQRESLPIYKLKEQLVQVRIPLFVCFFGQQGKHNYW